VSAAGAAAKEDLLKSSAKKDEELLALEREQADFQAQVEVLGLQRGAGCLQRGTVCRA